MSDQPAAATTAASTPDSPNPEALLQCRSLTVDGMQCRNRALRGKDFCYSHLRYRNSPNLPPPDKMVVPLLENHASIRLVLSQILNGILAREIPPDIGGKSIYCCQVALSSLPRPAAPAAQAAAAAPETSPEPVADVATDDQGNPIGPLQPWFGPTGAFEPVWSMAKYMYEQQCEQLGKPKPTCAADMPPSGWLTPAEAKEDPEAFNARYHARINELIKKNPPPPRPPDCPFSFDWCGGPTCSHHCNRCETLIQEKLQKAASSAPCAPGTEPCTGPPASGTVNLQAVSAEPCALYSKPCPASALNRRRWKSGNLQPQRFPDSHRRGCDQQPIRPATTKLQPRRKSVTHLPGLHCYPSPGLYKSAKAIGL